MEYRGYTIETDKPEYIVRTPEGYLMYELHKSRHSLKDCKNLIDSALAFKAQTA